MKVVFSITYYSPYVSGLSIAAGRFAHALLRAKHEVNVLCMKHDATLGEFGEVGGIGVIRAKPLLKFSKGFLSWDWVVRSWREVQKNDAVVVNLPQAEGCITALFAKIHAKRVVAIYHCEIVLPDGFLNGIIQSLLEVSNMMTLLLADTVITYTADYARSSKVLRSLTSLKQGTTIHYIVPPIPAPRVSGAKMKKLLKQAGNPDTVIGVSARLAREKGVEYLLEALPSIRKLSSRAKRGDPVGLPAGEAGIASSKTSRNDNIKIVIAGPMEPVGEDAYKRHIMTLVKKHRDDVVFLGEVNPADIGSFYAICTVLVLPSVNRTEAFGMVQVEAMKCGVPVVASNLPGVRVPVRKTGMGRTVPPGDPDALADAICEVVQNIDAFVYSAAEIEKIFSVRKSEDAFAGLFNENNT